MKRVVALVLGLVALSAASAARADDAPCADGAPRAQPAPAAAVEVGDNTRSRVGIGLIVGGSLGLVGGVVGNVAILAGNGGECNDGPCPRPVSPGAQAAAVAGTVAMGGLVVTGIYLLATHGAPPPTTTGARVRPTARGLGFSF